MYSLERRELKTQAGVWPTWLSRLHQAWEAGRGVAHNVTSSVGQRQHADYITPGRKNTPILSIFKTVCSLRLNSSPSVGAPGLAISVGRWGQGRHARSLIREQESKRWGHPTRPDLPDTFPGVKLKASHSRKPLGLGQLGTVGTLQERITEHLQSAPHHARALCKYCHAISLVTFSGRSCPLSRPGN